jgi:bacteriocin-like protein
MKTQTKNILEFKKSNIIELNDKQLNSINGGITGKGVTSSLPCLLTSSGTDPNGSSELCDP